MCHLHQSVVCRNCHEMIIHIVRSILYDYQEWARKEFATESFSLEDNMELKKMYDTSEINSPAFAYDADPLATAASLSFECNFSKEQMAGIVSCANTCHLLCVPTVRMEDMEALFACKEDKRFVTASSLSTAPDAARIRPTSVVYAIRTMIGRLP